MRTEMALYDERFPPKKNLLSRFKYIRDRIIMWYFAQKVRKIKVGSRKWHILQEKLSHGSSVGLAMKKRNTFYMHSLPNCGSELYVLPGVTIYFPHNIEMGNDVFLNRGVYITARAKIVIGDHVAIGPYTVINSGSHQYSDPNRPIRRQGHRLEPIIIEEGAWIGAHVTVLPGVTIGKGAVVGSGAVVTRSVPPNAVVVGVPARTMKFRGE